MSAAALWLPHEWDWSFFQWLSSKSEPTFSQRITIVNIPWNPSDLPTNRLVLARFLGALAASGARPEAVILDIEFDPCQTQPCAGAMETARSTLAAQIRAATRIFPVFATEEPPIDRDDAVSGPLDRHDALIYGALSGAAHTRLWVVPGSNGISYQICYPGVDFPDESGAIVGKQSVWSIVDRVLPDFSPEPCDTRHVAVRVGPALEPDSRSFVHVDSNGNFPVDATFDRQYVIVGTTRVDRSSFTDRSGPELLAWALSNQLEFGSVNESKSSYATQPQNSLLLLVVPAFSTLTALAFVALFSSLKRSRLGTLRHRLPLFSAIASIAIGLGAFAAFEALMYATHQIYPQVSLITLGIVTAGALSGYRGYQILLDQTNTIDEGPAESHDYDVFISYAHDEGAWVAENVYAAFRNARLLDGSKLSIFFDTESIRTGTSWQTKLALAIDGSRFIIPVYSDIYFTKPYCRFEILRAHRKWVLAGEGSRCVLPIMRGHPKILAAVDDIQAVSIDDNPNLVAQIVADIIESKSMLSNRS